MWPGNETRTRIDSLAIVLNVVAADLSYLTVMDTNTRLSGSSPDVSQQIGRLPGIGYDVENRIVLQAFRDIETCGVSSLCRSARLATAKCVSYSQLASSTKKGVSPDDTERIS